MHQTHVITAKQRRDESPLTGELTAIFDSIDDTRLMRKMWSYRWTGRRGHSPRSIWRAVIAGHYLNIPTTIGLVRRLQEDPQLLRACGFTAVPSRITIGRFLRRLVENINLVRECLANASRDLRRHLPDFGQEIAVDSTTITTYANPGREAKSDPEATWTRKPNSQRKLAFHYGYRLHLAVDARHEIPVHADVMTANINDQPTLPLVSSLPIVPETVSADAGYDSAANVDGLISLAIRPVIKKVAHKTTSGAWQRRHPSARHTIDQDSAEWRTVYARRVSVERAFARLKSHRGLTRHSRRRLEPVTLHCLLAVLTVQANALGKLSTGRWDDLRERARKVA